MKSIRISDKSYARLREVANSGHHKLIAAFDITPAQPGVNQKPPNNGGLLLSL